MRASASVEPPGGHGTIMRSERAGNDASDCAQASGVQAAIAMSAHCMRRDIDCRIVFSRSIDAAESRAFGRRWCRCDAWLSSPRLVRNGHGTHRTRAHRVRQSCVRSPSSAVFARNEEPPMSTQPVGEPVETHAAERPSRTTLSGRYVTVAALDPARHANDLYAAATGPDTAELWTYMFFGPWQDREAFDAWLAEVAAKTDPLAFTLIDAASGKALGMATHMRIEPTHRVIEVGGIWYSPALKRTRAATEAMYLMARHVFETLGYRRYEWKCNALNEPSRRAAVRLGFIYEGLFRQHMIVRGRNRDTAWYSMIDSEWPARKRAFERWLDAANFDPEGRQKASLSALMREEAR